MKGRLAPSEWELPTGFFAWDADVSFVVGGLMNLAWVGTIALFVLVEKTVAKGDWLSRFCGTLLIVWGGANLARLFWG